MFSICAQRREAVVSASLFVIGVFVVVPPFVAVVFIFIDIALASCSAGAAGKCARCQTRFCWDNNQYSKTNNVMKCLLVVLERFLQEVMFVLACCSTGCLQGHRFAKLRQRQRQTH